MPDTHDRNTHDRTIHDRTMRRTTKLARALALAAPLLIPALSGCASQKVIDDYEAEILALREERTNLKKENGDLKSQLSDYEVQLANANARLIDRPSAASAPAKPHADLVDLGLGVDQRGGNLVITLPAEISFASGQAVLSESGKKALKAVARTLSTDYGGGTYWIEGHTDTDPIRKSTFETNRNLSIARAMAVLHYLVEQCGLSDEKCVVAGHGEYRPVADNKSQPGKAKNRRVEIVVHAM